MAYNYNNIIDEPTRYLLGIIIIHFMFHLFFVSFLRIIGDFLLNKGADIKESSFE